MKIFKNILLLTLHIVLSFLGGLLSTHVIISVGNLYDVVFIESLTFLQVYGIHFLISFILALPLMGLMKDEDKELKGWKRPYTLLLAKVLFTLLIWGYAYLAYQVITNW